MCIIYIYNTHIYYLFFTHSSIDGHFAYFHNLAIVNNAVMSMCVLDDSVDKESACNQ